MSVSRETRRDVVGQIRRSRPTTDTPAFLRGDPDPLDVTTREGYDSGPQLVVPDERPVVDDRGMVVVWIVAAIAFLLAMIATVLLVAGRPPSA